MPQSGLHCPLACSIALYFAWRGGKDAGGMVGCETAALALVTHGSMQSRNIGLGIRSDGGTVYLTFGPKCASGESCYVGKLSLEKPIRLSLETDVECDESLTAGRGLRAGQPPKCHSAFLLKVAEGGGGG